MVPHTRRRLLQIAAAGLAGLAGCNALYGEASRSSETVSPTEGVDQDTSNATTDPPSVLLRADTTTPPARFSEPDETTTTSTPAEHLLHQRANLVIDSRDRSQRLTIDHPKRQNARTFLSKTDFSEETVYLETRRVQECYRLSLCSVSWRPDRISTEYARILRPYDESCAADDTVLEARLIRLPVALDEESVNSFATSVSGGGRCGTSRSAGGEGTNRVNESTPTSASVNGGESQ